MSRSFSQPAGRGGRAAACSSRRVPGGQRQSRAPINLSGFRFRRVHVSDYDPKQVALLDQAALDDAVAGAEKAFAAAADLDALHARARSTSATARR